MHYVTGDLLVPDQTQNYECAQQRQSYSFCTLLLPIYKTCKSFVMSTNGFFSYDSVTLLGQYAEKRGTWFVSWAQLRLQLKLCEAQAVILHMMKARTAAAPYTTEAASSQAV